MKHRQRTSPRVLRHFLQLAAVTFAINANALPPGRLDGSPARAGEQAEAGMAAPDAADSARAAPYLHSFTLPAAAPGTLDHAERASVRVLDANGRKEVQLALHGPGMVGPLADGAYTVLLKVAGLTEVHRLRIGPDTQAYLAFLDNA